jgi:hypothetical protein
MRQLSHTMPIFSMGNQRTIECMAKWRAPAGIEPPAWVRVYNPADWPNIYAWTAAAGDWFDAHHPEADAARWAWILSIPDEPFNPYGDAA